MDDRAWNLLNSRLERIELDTRETRKEINEVRKEITNTRDEVKSLKWRVATISSVLASTITGAGATLLKYINIFGGH